MSREAGGIEMILMVGRSKKGYTEVHRVKKRRFTETEGHVSRNKG